MAKKKAAAKKAPSAEAFKAEPIDAGDWRGHQNWGCPSCDFASLEKERVAAHIRAVHGSRTRA